MVCVIVKLYHTFDFVICVSKVPYQIFTAVIMLSIRTHNLVLSPKSHFFLYNLFPGCFFPQSAPAPLSAQGRSDDLTTILSVIADARKFVYISVMDYLPLSQYSDPVR